MAKTSELVRRITRAGCVLVRHGSGHDIYENPANGKRTSVPRHAKELPTGTYRGILRQLGLAE